MPVQVVVGIGRQICEGISVAHSSSPPIVHRDIKPQNIMVNDTGSSPVVKVSDFGLARNVNPLTLLASASGTLAFKPPEYLANVDSTAGDVWAIGVTLYLMLTDRMPYNASNDGLSINWQCNEELTLPSNYNKDIEPTLDRIIAKTLEKRAADRYPHAMALLQDLNAWRPSDVLIYATKTLAADAPPLAYGMLYKPWNPEDWLVEKALRLAADSSRLPEAVNLMEQALAHNPALRSKYSYRISLWKRGIVR
jgi:serine/threonine-protein kinase